MVDKIRHWFQHHKGRDLHRYEQLLGIDIPNILQKGIWIDVGTDYYATALKDLIYKTEVELIGVSSIQIDAQEKIKTIKCTLPDHLDQIEEFRGRAKLVTDVFGAMSYSHDPIAVILASCSLLGEGGSYFAVTESGRLGREVTYRHLSNFIRHHLRQKFSLELFNACGDYNKTFKQYLRLTSRLDLKPIQIELVDLVQESRNVLGYPVEGEILWKSNDEEVAIYRVDYVYNAPLKNCSNRSN